MWHLVDARIIASVTFYGFFSLLGFLWVELVAKKSGPVTCVNCISIMILWHLAVGDTEITHYYFVNFPGHPVPGPHHPHGNKFLPSLPSENQAVECPAGGENSHFSLYSSIPVN